MLIELIGISGSGKSTAARMVSRVLSEKGLRITHISSGYDLSGANRWCTRARDAAAGRVAGLVHTARLASLSGAAGVRLSLKLQLSALALMGQNCRALRSGGRYFLSDQGLVQRIGSLSHRSVDEVAFFSSLDVNAMRSLPWPDSVLFLDISPEVSFDRVRSRGGKLALVADQDLRALLNRSERIAQEQVLLLKRLDISVKRISAAIEKRSLAVRVACYIEGLIRRNAEKLNLTHGSKFI